MTDPLLPQRLTWDPPTNPGWIEARRVRAEDIALIYSIEAHLVTDDLSPGYWEAALARRIRRRSIRARLRRVLRDAAERMGRALG